MVEVVVFSFGISTLLVVPAAVFVETRRRRVHTTGRLRSLHRVRDRQ